LFKKKHVFMMELVQYC